MGALQCQPAGAFNPGEKREGGGEGRGPVVRKCRSGFSSSPLLRACFLEAPFPKLQLLEIEKKRKHQECVPSLGNGVCMCG